MGYSKEQIGVLEELLKRLNGKCSDKGKTCPAIIDYSLFHHDHIRNWICEDCGKMFAFAFGGDARRFLRGGKCPCQNPKTKPIAIATVEETIADYYKRKEKR